MTTKFLHILYNCRGKCTIQFVYLIIGNEWEKIEFEMQKRPFTQRDAKGNLVYLFPLYFGDDVNINTNHINNVHYFDCGELNREAGRYQELFKLNYWLEKYKQTGNRNWLINRVDYMPETLKGLKKKSKIPIELKRTLRNINYS